MARPSRKSIQAMLDSVIRNATTADLLDQIATSPSERYRALCQAELDRRSDSIARLEEAGCTDVENPTTGDILGAWARLK